MIAADAPILFCKACESVYLRFNSQRRGRGENPRCIMHDTLGAHGSFHVSTFQHPFPPIFKFPDLVFFFLFLFLLPRSDEPTDLKRSPLVFISEITARAFIIADSNKRRTLSRADIAKALAKSDQFDFLIDIVPREEGLTGLGHTAPAGGVIAGGNNLVAGVSPALLPFSFLFVALS